MNLQTLSRAIVLAVLVTGFGVAAVQARSESTSAMPLGALAAAPTGFVELCERSPVDCIAAARPSDRMLSEVRDWAGRARWSSTFQRAGLAVASTSTGSSLSSARAVADISTADLEVVSRRINRAIRRSPDADAYGREDVWALPEGRRPTGDCEDYVLAKRRALIGAGVDPAALAIAIVRTRQGEIHAVLLVTTRDGEQVLDNLSPWVLPWRDAPYEWLERQAPGQPLVWVHAA